MISSPALYYSGLRIWIKAPQAAKELFEELEEFIHPNSLILVVPVDQYEPSITTNTKKDMASDVFSLKKRY